MDEQTAGALNDLLLAQAGQIRGLEVINDTLITTLGRAFPELLDALKEGMGTVAHWGEEHLEEGSRDSYHLVIDKMNLLIETLQES